MKAYKIELVYIDHEGYGPTAISNELHGSDLMFVELDVKEADIGEFDDDHPLNFADGGDVKYAKELDWK